MGETRKKKKVMTMVVLRRYLNDDGLLQNDLSWTQDAPQTSLLSASIITSCTCSTMERLPLWSILRSKRSLIMVLIPFTSVALILVP